MKSEGIFIFYKDKGVSIETSKGMNVGLIASLTIHARVNIQGSLKNPFYKISKISKEKGIIHLLAGEDEYHQIATGNVLALDQRTQKVHVTLACYRQEFLAIVWEQIHLRGIYLLQYFLLGLLLFLFLNIMM